MLHRPTVSLGLLVVAAAAGLPASAVAGPITTYQFTNATGGPVSRADFSVIPPGTVRPPVIGTDPATGQPLTASPVTLDPTRSSGFDPNNFSTALGTGANVQGLRLLFGQRQVIEGGEVRFEPVPGPAGEPPRFLDNGGVVTFDLSLDPAFQGILQLKSLTNGISDPIVVATRGDGGGNDPGGPPPPSIPEPVSLAVWSTAAGFGLLGLRRRAARAA